ncbi:hypothetical protein OU798_17965 [Prolixibacteraceae bacterium Z1-6]|uniref:DUF4890 domain-containing protein n=1 Tax=Draconibacterium aestuarii TaxID=2998507 RepID=A0A9X3F8A6_9BACT|nr:hypothetical protein [Prolixibacteraceae bacterium Z1-6]
MKKLGLLMMIVIFGATLSLAQNRDGQRNFDPEEMAKRQTKELTELLSLDKAQAQKVHELNLESGKKMSKMREEMQGGGDREAMREKMTEMRKKQNAEMKKILSEDQYTKYEKYLEERRARRGGSGGGQR